MKAVLTTFFLFVFSVVSLADENQSELFAPGVISTEAVDFCSSFSSDLNEVYFVRSSDQWGKRKSHHSIYFSSRKDGRWQEPSVASFSGEFNDSDPHLTDDGKTLYFISTRPSEAAHESADIWRVRRAPGGSWGIPERLGDHINSDQSEYGPTITKQGDLYFASDRGGGYGQGDIYKAEQQGAEFLPPVNLGRVINGPKGEWNLEISDDGEVLIFEASGREENRSSFGDLYISFQKINSRNENAWSTPQNIIEINTTGSDLCPEMVHKGSQLFYSSSQALSNGWVNIYQVNFESLLRKYRSSATLAIH
jgi:Tol biopolymer transport system component